MDSFFEEPRSIPKPTPIIQEIESLSVPEVSLLFQNNKTDKIPVNFKQQPLQSYNAWKLRTSPSNTNNTEFDSFVLPHNKENISVQDVLAGNKKQVRFESPILNQTRTTANNSNNYSPPICQRTKKTSYNFLLDKSRDSSNVLPSKPELIHLNHERTGSKPEINSRFESITARPNFSQHLQNPTNTISNSSGIKPFEKLYVSNIPNKDLDLSLLEAHNTRLPSNHLKTNYNTCFNTHLYDKQFNTRFIKDNLQLLNNSQSILNENPTKSVTSTATNTTFTSINRRENDNETIETKEPIEDKTNDKQVTIEAEKTPTVNDLLTIIKLQNKQLQLLQEQVDKLIKINEDNEKNTKQPEVEKKDECVETSFYKNDQMPVIPENDENQSKISVGLMTSFEVSFKPNASKKKQKNLMDCVMGNDVSFHEAHRMERRNRRMKKSDKDCQSESNNVENFAPKNYVANNNNNNKMTNETEYSLGSHEFVDIQEPPESPESSIHIDMNDYDTDTESDDENSSEDVSWTFYRDILGQVNNILENSSPATRDNLPQNRKYAQEKKITDTTLQKIKNAALQRLKTESFVKHRNEEKKRQNDQCMMKSNDISFAVKQLLMKYMPDEGIANVVTRNEQEYNESPNDVSSVAIFKYMQQCNVVTNSNSYYAKTTQNKPKYPSKNKSNRNGKEQKILDITTLKQQPKLL